MTTRGLRGAGGFVTAETALVLPTLVGLGLALVALVTAAVDQLRCADAAWEAARGLARGGSLQTADAVVSRLAPAGADLSVSVADGSVDVRVMARLAFSGALIPVVRVAGRATAPCELLTACSAADLRSGR